MKPPMAVPSARTQRTWITDNLPLRSENKEKDENSDGNSIFAAL
ncbi:hypothetical protein T4D_295 [Trichinella pseudospiralis]|uniref:Uncharacterized protein n=1 Tax=Trichinella pseudospiralis TaxID=6337 RepID=A0A0V1DKP7_TRIPS|nr:hypothetical protein T4D_295 [Trichinella pseudospiralis]